MTQDKNTSEQIRKFAKSLEKKIAGYTGFAAAKKIDHLEAQRAQMELLFSLEDQFKDCIRTHSKGLWAYQRFVKYITKEQGNILFARPYFRERQTLFTAEISPALKQQDAKSIMKFHPNYRLIKYLFKLRKWPIKVTKLFDQIENIRTELCTTNMPLGISRARIFWSKTPESHLSYMDEIQVAAEGLLAGIDKYVPPFTRNFRAVLIGRCTGNLIADYSQTLLHFWPDDKSKIYRGNKASRKNSGNLQAMSDSVNDGLKERQKTNPDELALLMSASSVVSTESAVSDPNSPKNQTKITTLGETLSADPAMQPDNQAESSEVIYRLYQAISHLSVLEQKVLKMKGLIV